LKDVNNKIQGIKMIELLRKYMNDNMLDQTDMAKLLDCSEGLISGVLRGKVQPSKNFRKAFVALTQANKGAIIHGDNNHIDIHHVADPLATDYSPATATINDIIKDWSEHKRRILLGEAIKMNGKEPKEE
jgi:predicted transcriptional regulator